MDQAVRLRIFINILYGLTLAGPHTLKSKWWGQFRLEVTSRRDLHVLFVNTRDLLGADVAVHQLLARQLARNGIRVTFTVNRDARERAEMSSALAGISGLFVMECPLGRPLEGRRERLTYLLTGLRNSSVALSIGRLAAHIRRQRVDVLHTTDRPRDALLTIVLGRLTGRPTVVHMHSNYIGLSSTTLWAIQKCTRVVTVSDFINGSLKDTGVPAERLVTIHNAVDAAHFHPDAVTRGAFRKQFGIPSDAPLIALVGRLIQFKGHEDLLQAIVHAGCNLAKAHFVIVGSTNGFAAPYVEELSVRIRELGLSDRVHFTGYVRDTRPVYADIDVLAVPSWDEPFGLVVTEAMAMQVPVLAYRSGGIPEIIASGSEGILVSPRNTAELGDALVSLMRDPDLRARMGEAGRRRVLAEFNPQRQMYETVAVYRTLRRSERKLNKCATYT